MRPADLIALLAPPRCVACDRPSVRRLCTPCETSAPWRPATDSTPPPGSGLEVCTTLLWLEGPVPGWLHRLKYPAPGLGALDGTGRGLADELSWRLGARLAPEPGDWVVPIPLHPRRLRARGFNQAGLIAWGTARRAGLPYRPGVLDRVRDTPSQTGLGRAARRENVRGAFATRALRSPPDRVWLVDDVVTTGATLSEAAAVLRAAGVRRVMGLGLARTPGPRPAPLVVLTKSLTNT